jgi:YidC/Oxa1 family membrane protein insertase
MTSFLKSWRGYSALSRETDKKIVFYSEGRAYWINFKAAIKSLVEDHGQKVHYVTSAADDPVLNQAGGKFRPFYIGHEFFRILLFKTAKADIFLTTLPDIGTFHLQRPPAVKTFVYIPHTLGSLNMVYLPGAFDSYDAVMCSGPHQILEAREMEAFYRTRPKVLIPAGYPPLDDLLERLENANLPLNEWPAATGPVATLAPSWQPENLIDRAAGPLIKSLLESGFTVRLRPHPRTLQFEFRKVKALAAQFASEERFQFDNTPGGFDSYLTTDLMVTDWSGTGFKFALARLKPVLFINTPAKVRNPDYHLFENVPSELGWRKIIGCDLEEARIHLAGATARRLLADAAFSARLEEFRNGRVFNIRRGGKAVAEAIMRFMREERSEAL